MTDVQLRTGNRRMHRRALHPHSDQCGRAKELGAARHEEAKEEAREQLPRGLIGARASSSSAVASRARMRATPQRPHERAEREAEVVAHPLGSSHGEQLLRRAGSEGRAKPVVRATSRRWAMELWPWAMELRRAVSHPGAGAGRQS